MKKNKRMMFSKANMLTHNKAFKKDCNTLRKEINGYRTGKTSSSNLSEFIGYMLVEYLLGFSTLCDVIRIAPATLRGYIRRYPIFPNRKPSEASYLVDRVHNARLILDGLKTRREVAIATDTHYTTVCSWVNDYKLFGNKMINQAIAFRREHHGITKI